jgi:hypothetical protein
MNAMSNTHSLEDVGAMHYIYLGASKGGQIDAAYEKAAMDECSTLFASFCVTRATGVFRGNREDTLIFHISTSDTGGILQLASRLRERFDQDGVGVIRPTSQGAHYSRVVKPAPTESQFTENLV